jgi:hypothetical protein
LRHAIKSNERSLSVPLDDVAPLRFCQRARCYRDGGVDNAVWASARVVDQAFQVACSELDLDPNDFKWDPDAAPPMPLVREQMHPAVQDALSRQLSDLDSLEREGINQTMLRSLRRR